MESAKRVGSLSGGSERMGNPYTEEGIREIDEQVKRSCHVAGLSRQDGEDVAQDIWEWLLRNAYPPSALSSPWLRAVVHNFILRYWRRKYRTAAHEERGHDETRESSCLDPMRSIEAKEALDRISTALPSVERAMFSLLRRGHSVAEAARILGIPRGSSAHFHTKLIESARLRIRTGR